MHCLQGNFRKSLSCMDRAWLAHAHTGSPATLNCHVAQPHCLKLMACIMLCLTAPHLQT